MATSSSIIANGEFYEHALKSVVNQDVIKFYGLHLNLTEGKALNKGSINILSDESNKFKVGDNVKIIESKPYSKKKRWEVIDK